MDSATRGFAPPRAGRAPAHSIASRPVAPALDLQGNAAGTILSSRSRDRHESGKYRPTSGLSLSTNPGSTMDLSDQIPMASAFS